MKERWSAGVGRGGGGGGGGEEEEKKKKKPIFKTSHPATPILNFTATKHADSALH